MKFVWDLMEKNWPYNPNEYEDDLLGMVRTGDLCFDLIVRNNGGGYKSVDYDLYCGGVDMGYGYAGDNQYPYDYVGGDGFDDDCTDMSLEEFKEMAEKEFEFFIKDQDRAYSERNLIDKANEPLNVW